MDVTNSVAEASAESGQEDDQSQSSSLSSSLRSKQSRVTNASSVYHLAEKVHRKLCIPENSPLPVKSHRSAVDTMLILRDYLEQLTVDADRDVRMLLMYSGITTYRRRALSEDDDEKSDLQITTTLLFMLQVLCDQRARQPLSPEPLDSGALSPALVGPRKEGGPDVVEQAPVMVQPEQDVIKKWRNGSIWEMMQQVVRDQTDESGWAEAVRTTPNDVARACLIEASRLGDAAGLADVGTLATTFMHCSALALQYNMLEQQRVREDPRSFLSLSSATFMMNANTDAQDQKLRAIADAAESEAGQQVLRDMILSFSLPEWVVGVRRTPLLSREANAIATERFTKELGAAHEAAMRGAQWCWQEDPDEINKVGALMAGLCILLAGRGEGTDHIRKRDAFRGRVQLPFLQTSSPADDATRIGFVPHNNTWLVFKVDRHGQPVLSLKHSGFQGMCHAVLLMAQNLTS